MTSTTSTSRDEKVESTPKVSLILTKVFRTSRTWTDLGHPLPTWTSTRVFQKRPTVPIGLETVSEIEK